MTSQDSLSPNISDILRVPSLDGSDFTLMSVYNFKYFCLHTEACKDASAGEVAVVKKHFVQQISENVLLLGNVYYVCFVHTSGELIMQIRGTYLEIRTTG